MRLGGGPPILASTRSAREQKAYYAPAAGHDRACSAYGYAVAVLPVVEPAPQSYHYRLCQTESRHKGFNPPSTKRFVAKMTRFADVPDVLRCRDAWSILGSPKGKRTQREPKKFSGGGIGGHNGWWVARGNDERPPHANSRHPGLVPGPLRHQAPASGSSPTASSSHLKFRRSTGPPDRGQHTAPPLAPRFRCTVDPGTSPG